MPDGNTLSNEAITILIEDASTTTNAAPIPCGEIGNAKQDSTFVSQVKEPRKKRVLVVGSVGAGKSSLINMLAEQAVTPVGDGAHGCTQDIIRIAIKHNNAEYEFIDSPGLEGVSTAENPVDSAIPKLFLFLASERQNFNCVLFVWRKGRINKAFDQSIRLLKDQLMKRAVPFILVVTGCEMEQDLAETRMSLDYDFKDFFINSIVCGTTLFGGILEHYMSGIRETMKAELWQRIEQFCDDSFISIGNIQDDPSSGEQNNPLWWRIIQTVYQYLVAGYERGMSVIEGYVYVTPTLDGRGLHMTDTPRMEQDNQ